MDRPVGNRKCARQMKREPGAGHRGKGSFRMIRSWTSILDLENPDPCLRVVSWLGSLEEQSGQATSLTARWSGVALGLRIST